MSGKLDFKKEYRDLYLPGDAPALIEVPPMRFIMVDGAGDPNGEEYHQAMELLYSLSFTIKMSKLSGKAPEGYFEYVVPPLEGLWDCGAAGFNPARDAWRWTSMIRQPDFVTDEVFDRACGQVAKKKPGFQVPKARLELYEEKLCVQLMHTGPYSAEQASIDKITAFIAENNLTDECGSGRNDRRHHEIYLSDPRKTKPEKLKTVLRHLVSRN